MRILVTGHLGYIGSHLVPLLNARGHEVVGVDVKDGEAHDIASVCSDLTSVYGAMAVYGVMPCDAVVHLAAQCVVGESLSDPLSCWHTNAAGTRQVLHAITFPGKAAFRGRFVLASTLLARHPESSPYAASKLACEHMVIAAARTHGFSAACLRLGNVAGGSDPTPSRLIPAACRATRAEQFFPVHTGHPTPDGTAVRDYVHVLDVADAICCALDAPLGVRETAVVDIGTGTGVGVYGVLQTLGRVSGQYVRVDEKQSRPGDVTASVAEPLAAQRVLGWQPTRTLTDMVVDAWEASEG